MGVARFLSSQLRANRLRPRWFSTTQHLQDSPRDDQASFADARLSQITIANAAYREGNPGAAEERPEGGQVLPGHLLDACAARMEYYKECGALAFENLSLARETSGSSELRRLHGRSASVMDGIPIAVKGNFGSRDLPLCSQRTPLIPRRYRCPYDATLLKRAQSAGMVVVGATPLDEYGIGARDMFTCPHAVLSPWRSRHHPEEERVAGGQSSAPAVAVAAGMAAGALASDLGGSLRVPAAFTGTVGFKPSRGRLSKAGLITLSSRLDDPGFVTRAVADAALLTALLQGEDENDPDTAEPCRQLEGLLSALQDRPHVVAHSMEQLLGFPAADRPLQGTTIAIFREQVAPVSGDIRKAFSLATVALKKAGASIMEVALPDDPERLTKDMSAAFYRLAVDDGFATLEDLDSVLPDLDRFYPPTLPEHRYEKPQANGPPKEYVKDILRFLEKPCQESAVGHHASGARRFQQGLSATFSHLFSDRQVAAILLPVTAGQSPSVEEAKRWGVKEKETLDAFNLPATLAGLPAITLPVAMSEEGLPLGLQLVGPRFGDASVLAIAQVLERCAARGETASDGLLPVKAASEGSAAKET